MSSALVLADAIEQMLPDDLNLFTAAVKLGERGQTAEAALPWVVVIAHLPVPATRSLAGRRHASTATVTMTIAGMTPNSVRVICDRVISAVEHQRPAAAGWNTGRMRLINARPISEDPDITLTGTNRKVVYTVLEWELTVAEA